MDVSNCDERLDRYDVDTARRWGFLPLLPMARTRGGAGMSERLLWFIVALSWLFLICALVAQGNCMLSRFMATTALASSGFAMGVLAEKLCNSMRVRIVREEE